MSKYYTLYDKLGIPNLAAEIALGKIELGLENNIPFVSNGFPPALIPLWSTSSGYVGYWRHWFSLRRLTIVQVEYRDHYQAFEIARNIEQLVIQRAANLIAGRGRSVDSVKKILVSAGINSQHADLAIVTALQTGDNPKYFTLHASFQDCSPLICYDDPELYNGDFPTSNDSSLMRSDVCGFEFSVEDLLNAIPNEVSSWISPTNGHLYQYQVFEECIRNKNYSGAWFSMNSPSWKLDDLKCAFNELVRVTRSKNLKLVFDAWKSERQGFLA